jgi:predicted HTH transcriptional regulator
MFFVNSESLHKGSYVEVILPEGATLSDDYFIFPKGYELTTNGQNIIVSWDNCSEKEILIPYNDNKESFSWFLYIIIGIILIGFTYFRFFYSKKDYSKNLFKEEKQIVNYLYKKGECWTKEIVRDLDISKVKLSRKLRNLEERGLIQREPHGNENRIKLRK